MKSSISKNNISTLSLPASYKATVPEKVNWLAASEYPATTIPGIGLETFSQMASKYSWGKLLISNRFDFPVGAIEIFDYVREDRVQVADIHGGPLGSIEPVFNLVSLPFLTSSIDDTKCLQAATRKVYGQRFERNGLHLLYSAPWPATGLWSSSPVASMDDLRKLRIRTYDTTSAALLASAGVTGVNMPFGQAMPLIANSEISGVMSSGDGGAGWQLWQHLRYFTALNYAAPLSFSVVNKLAYDSLPRQLRDAVDRAAEDTEAKLWDIMQKRQEENYQSMKEHGVSVQLIVADDVKIELQRNARNIIDAWVDKTGPDATMLLEDFEYLKRVGIG
ncbi:TRAP transporter substrate-binding protein [Billgrantia endophytica]|uniref:Signal peptidase n=1 Tax=Billgrantia endophytica TaxID=2033802 RepID=A0A2N7U4F5_9GAMM|nr:TRAP transporter substrate-binding protein [Halomonas endophytica]PMR75314.1 signal peptidase [Halomonas endophytica]